MENQPWNRRKFNPITNIISLRGLPLLIGISSIIVLIISLSTPSLEALASRIAQFFTTSSDRHEWVMLPEENFPIQTAFSDLSIYEAAELAGFEIQIPSDLPSEFAFSGAEYSPERQVVTLKYTSLQGAVLKVSQRPIGLEYRSISVSAKIDIVKIGEVKGEFVVGGWKAASTPSIDQGSKLEGTLQAVWDPDADIQFLSWQGYDKIFEIIYSGFEIDSDVYLDKNAMIRIAESIN